jgi:hypothetical protein
VRDRRTVLVPTAVAVAALVGASVAGSGRAAAAPHAASPHDTPGVIAVTVPAVTTVGRATTVTVHVPSAPPSAAYPNGLNGQLSLDIGALTNLPAADFRVTEKTGTVTQVITLSNNEAVGGAATDAVGSVGLGGGYLPYSGGRTTTISVTPTSAAVRGELYLYVEFDANGGSDYEADNGAAIQDQQDLTTVPKATPYDVAQRVAYVSTDGNGLPDAFYAQADAASPATVEVEPGTLASVLTPGKSTIVGGDIFGSGDDYPVYYDQPLTGQPIFYIADGFDTVSTGVVEVNDYRTITGFGDPGDIPLVGAFPIPSSNAAYPEGSTDDIAVWRPSTARFYVYGGASGGLQYGQQGDIPIVGNWTGTRDIDGDQGGDGVGIFRPGTHTFWLLEQNGRSVTANYGATGDTPVVGDWNGNGVSTIGVRRGTTYLLAKTNANFYPGDAAAGSNFAVGAAGDATFGAYTWTFPDLTAVASASAPSAQLARAAHARVATFRGIHAVGTGTRTLG